MWNCKENIKMKTPVSFCSKANSSPLLRSGLGKKSGAHRRAAGLSLVEVLISLAIVALLLTATGIAFDAALDNYKINHDMASVSVAARNALYQMTSTIRSSWNLDPDTDPNAAIYVAVDGMSCTMLDASDRVIIYRYDDASDELQVNIDGASEWYVMVENVFPVTVGDEIFTADLLDSLVSRVQIRFQVSQEDLSRTISAAAVPRNILYGE